MWKILGVLLALFTQNKIRKDVIGIAPYSGCPGLVDLFSIASSTGPVYSRIPVREVGRRLTGFERISTICRLTLSIAMRLD